MPDDESEVNPRLLLPPRAERYIDVRPQDHILVSREQLLLYIRQLEESRKIPSLKLGIYGVITCAIAGAVAWREFQSSDDWSVLAGAIFTVVSAASGYSGITDLIEAIRKRSEHNITTEDVVRVIEESSQGRDRRPDIDKVVSHSTSDGSTSPFLLFVGILLGLILLASRITGIW